MQLKVSQCPSPEHLGNFNLVGSKRIFQANRSSNCSSQTKVERDCLWLRCERTLQQHQQERQNKCMPSHIMQVQQMRRSGQWWFQSWKECFTTPIQENLNQALQADSIDDFPTSLMTIGKMADDPTVSLYKGWDDSAQGTRCTHHVQKCTHTYWGKKLAL